MLVGLTGGIGSGKTAVSDAFSELGVPIVDSDIIARTILQKKPELLNALSKRFGKTILNENNELIRDKLREIAFTNDANKADLDAIMHPAIRTETLEKIALYDSQPYCIVVVPLLIETNFKDLVDHILVVTAPIELRLEWLEKRSGLNTAKATAIISKQSTDEMKLKFADDHLSNDGTLEDIAKQVKKLHKKYTLKAAEFNNSSLIILQTLKLFN